MNEPAFSTYGRQMWPTQTFSQHQQDLIPLLLLTRSEARQTCPTLNAEASTQKWHIQPRQTERRQITCRVPLIPFPFPFPSSSHASDAFRPLQAQLVFQLHVERLSVCKSRRGEASLVPPAATVSPEPSEIRSHLEADLKFSTVGGRVALRIATVVRQADCALCTPCPTVTHGGTMGHSMPLSGTARQLPLCSCCTAAQLHRCTCTCTCTGHATLCSPRPWLGECLPRSTSYRRRTNKEWRRNSPTGARFHHDGGLQSPITPIGGPCRQTYSLVVLVLYAVTQKPLTVLLRPARFRGRSYDQWVAHRRKHRGGFWHCPRWPIDAGPAVK